jgi:hypothetical protein
MGSFADVPRGFCCLLGPARLGLAPAPQHKLIFGLAGPVDAHQKCTVSGMARTTRKPTMSSSVMPQIPCFQ